MGMNLGMNPRKPWFCQWTKVRTKTRTYRKHVINGKVPMTTSTIGSTQPIDSPPVVLNFCPILTYVTTGNKCFVYTGILRVFCVEVEVLWRGCDSPNSLLLARARKIADGEHFCRPPCWSAPSSLHNNHPVSVLHIQPWPVDGVCVPPPPKKSVILCQDDCWLPSLQSCAITVECIAKQWHLFGEIFLLLNNSPYRLIGNVRRGDVVCSDEGESPLWGWGMSRQCCNLCLLFSWIGEVRTQFSIHDTKKF